MARCVGQTESDGMLSEFFLDIVDNRIKPVIGSFIILLEEIRLSRTPGEIMTGDTQQANSEIARQIRKHQLLRYFKHYMVFIRPRFK